MHKTFIAQMVFFSRFVSFYLFAVFESSWFEGDIFTLGRYECFCLESSEPKKKVQIGII
jgi:hypothetical protein